MLASLRWSRPVVISELLLYNHAEDAEQIIDETTGKYIRDKRQIYLQLKILQHLKIFLISGVNLCVCCTQLLYRPCGRYDYCTAKQVPDGQDRERRQNFGGGETHYHQDIQ